MNLRIGILTDQFPSRGNPDRGTFIQDLVKHLRSAGIAVVVISHEKNFAAMSLECFMKSAQVDLLDAQFVAPAGVVAALTPRFSPFVITVHRWDIFEFPHKWPMARIATLVALGRASGIIAVGRAVKSELMKFVPPKSIVAVIPNAVDTERFRPGLEFSSLKERLGIPESHGVILSVGRLIPRKGFQFLLQAMAGVVKEFHSCTLVIVGGGPQRRALEELGQRLGLGNRLKFTGTVEDSVLPSVYAMADIFVMPSLSEGHCVSILEAMSAAKPVVASAIPANAESVLHWQNGFLVQPKNCDALASGIVRLLQDEQLRDDFGRCSREIAVREFGWGLRLRRLTNFYESLLG